MKLNNKGTVLLIAAFIVLLSSVLVIGFLETATTDIEISRNQKSDVIATYIADAGIEAAIYDILNSGDGNIARTEFPDTASNNTYYTTTQIDKAGSIYTIQSVGEYGSYQKTIQTQIEVIGIFATLQCWREV